MNHNADLQTGRFAVGLLSNLARIATAPVEIIDKTVVEPIADMAEDAVDGKDPDDE